MPGEKDSVKHFTFIILNPAGPVLQRVAYTVFNSSKPASFSKPSATLLPSLNQNSLDEALLLTLVQSITAPALGRALTQQLMNRWAGHCPSVPTCSGDTQRIHVKRGPRTQ